METRPITYFSQPGPVNTERTIDLALERAIELGIQCLLVASSTGDTALALATRSAQRNYTGQIVVVSYHAGFAEPGKTSLSSEQKNVLEERGCLVLIGSHAFSGISRSFRLKFGGVSIPEIVAESYRRISEGFKVAIEIALMAADAAMVPVNQEVISIGGSGQGADTAILLKPGHQNSFFQTKIHQIICYPNI